MAKLLNLTFAEKQQASLAKLQSRSENALSIVTSTINNLNAINAEIDETISGIEAYQKELETTQGQLSDTKTKNQKILNKFKNLIED